MRRTCVRPSCSESASWMLTYDYASGTAWLDDLTPTRSPQAWEVCDRHADTLQVPRGWTLDDRRAAAQRLFPASLAG